MRITQNGNKTILIIGIIIFSMLLTGCPGFSDWDYDLPNNCQIVKVNSSNILFGKEQGTGDSIVIDRFVIAFCYNGRHIGIQRIPIDDSYPGIITYEDLDHSKVEYYLFDSATDVKSGPWSVDEFNDALEKQGISDMCQWITTDKKPEGAN